MHNYGVIKSENNKKYGRHFPYLLCDCYFLNRILQVSEDILHEVSSQIGLMFRCREPKTGLNRQSKTIRIYYSKYYIVI